MTASPLRTRIEAALSAYESDLTSRNFSDPYIAGAEDIIATVRDVLAAVPAAVDERACWFCSHVHTEPTICRARAIDGGPCVCQQDPRHPAHPGASR